LLEEETGERLTEADQSSQVGKAEAIRGSATGSSRITGRPEAILKLALMGLAPSPEPRHAESLQLNPASLLWGPSIEIAFFRGPLKYR